MCPRPRAAPATCLLRLQCDLEFVVPDGVKWAIVKPGPAWFAERPFLPRFCSQGDLDHLAGGWWQFGE